MKLAERRAAEKEATYSEKSLSALKADKNPKAVFDALKFNFDGHYTPAACQIFDEVKKNGGFVADIATRFSTSNYEMSEKQAWCIAYAFIK